MQEQAPSVGNWGFIPLRISRGMYEVHLGVVPSEGEEAGVLTLLLPFIHHPVVPLPTPAMDVHPTCVQGRPEWHRVALEQPWAMMNE